MTKLKKGAVLAAVVLSVGLAGCASQKSVDELSARVSALESSSSATNAAAAAASKAAGEAKAMAQSAQNNANQAMQAASAAQACCDANSDKIERMFERAQRK